MTRTQVAFVIQWTLATTLGVAIGHLVADTVWFGASGRWLFPLVPYGGATLGLPVGVLQWLILRRRVQRSGSWMLATAAGWAGSWMLGSSVAIVIAAAGGNLMFFVAMSCGTLIVGLAQRHVLREWSTRAESWLLASTAGWIAWVAIEVFAPGALEPVSTLASRWVSSIAGYQTSSTLGATLVGGLCLGAVTGVALAWALEAAGTVKPHGIRLKSSSSS